MDLSAKLVPKVQASICKQLKMAASDQTLTVTIEEDDIKININHCSIFYYFNNFICFSSSLTRQSLLSTM